MKKKELKNLAKRIADAEYIIQHSEDEKEIRKAKETVLDLSTHAIEPDDFFQLDILIQDFLSKKTS